MHKEKLIAGLIRAAIYARKSDDDNDKVADNKSISRQVERAKEFIQKNGWVWDESRIYVDDGIPGADFVNRSGLIRLRSQTDTFDVVIMSELSRLGRDGDRTAYEVVCLIEEEKRIFYYLTGEEEKAGTPTERLMLRLKTYVAEMEREKLSERVKDQLYRLAKNGYNAGGRVYGYSNVRLEGQAVNGAMAKRGTEYKIDPDEAFVVDAIYRMYRDGHGYDSIAKILNGDSDPRIIEKRIHYLQGVEPKPSRITSTAWGGPTVRSMLTNERYRGVFTYGKKVNGYAKGKKTRTSQKDPSKIVILNRPELQIINDELWFAVATRLKAECAAYQASKRAPSGWGGKPVTGERDSKYLLSSLAECQICGRSIVQIGGSSGTGATRRIAPKYGCSGNHRLGDGICTNDHKVRVEEFDLAVIQAIRQQVLSEEAIDFVVASVLKALDGPDDSMDRVRQYETELARVTRAIDNLVKLVQRLAGDDDEIDPEIDRISKQIDENRGTKQTLTAELERAKSIASCKTFDEPSARELLRQRMSQLYTLMTGNVSLARHALKLLLTSKISVKPVTRDGQKGFEFCGKTVVGNLLSDPDPEPEPDTGARRKGKNHTGFNSSWRNYERRQCELMLPLS